MRKKVDFCSYIFIIAYINNTTNIIMSKTLIVVESGGKINKIKQILNDKYDVIASNGHILEINPNSMSIDFNNNFEPSYTRIKRQGATIDKLEKVYSKAKDILLACDPDREGEMIAWSIARELNIKNPKRIVFNSITETAILDALKNVHTIDDNYLNASQTRQIFDRITGYTWSPIMWKLTGDINASAGRVQSVVLKMIVDNENEINAFNNKSSNSQFKFTALLSKSKKQYETHLCSYNAKTQTIKNIKIPSYDESMNYIKLLSKGYFLCW